MTNVISFCKESLQFSVSFVVIYVIYKNKKIYKILEE